MRSELQACASQARPCALAQPLLSFAAVNGWRGPGAITIAMAHFGLATGFVAARHLFPIALLVDLFFVLSGLMIAQAYRDKLTSAANIPEYAMRRLGRIWPVQAATLAVLVAYELVKLAAQSLFGFTFSSPPFSASGGSIVEAIPTNLLLVQSLGLHDRETWNFPSWSLSVEFATYLAFAAFCLATPKLRRLLTLATILLSMLILVVVAPRGMRSTYDYGIFRCLAGFFTGTLCYEAATRWGPPQWRYSTLIEVAAVAVVVGWIALSSGSAAGFAAPVVFALFVFVFLGEGGLLSRVLRTPVLQRLAELSFSIYMVHALVLMSGLAMLRALARTYHLDLFHTVEMPKAVRQGPSAMVEMVHLDGTLAKAVVLALYLAGLLVATAVTHRIVEVPGRLIFVRLAKRLGSVAAKVAAPGRTLDASVGSVEHAP